MTDGGEHRAPEAAVVRSDSGFYTPEPVGGRAMTYTLWSQGRLLATTDLGWVRCMPRHRAGDLQPTEVGEVLLAVACGVRPALRLHGHDFDHPAVLTAIERSEALRLELRGPDGEVIPTEDLWIQDSEYLLALAREEPLPEPTDEELEELAELEEMEVEAWDPENDAALAELPDVDEPFERDFDDEAEEREWPRFQVMLVLVDDADVP
jgi:hypothetical protein